MKMVGVDDEKLLGKVTRSKLESYGHEFLTRCDCWRRAKRRI